MKEETFSEVRIEDLPSDHFSDTDIKREWNTFLDKIRKQDLVIYSAVHGFVFNKTSENSILVHYPSESAKAEFDKIHGEFFNHFKRKVNNYQLKVEFQMDVALKKEILTKRKIFEKMLEINPLLKDLDDLMKFDFT